MKYEKSCGAVVFTRINNKINYLLIQNREGIYGFPKGHVEEKETEIQTAIREVYEEVGIKVELIDGFRVEDEHLIPQKENIIKKIVYFLGEYSNQDFNYQKEELSNALLVDYETALTLFQFESSKRILKEANDLLVNLKYISKDYEGINRIGSKVKVIIDRPLGTYHPNHPDIFYTVNYGYIEGTIAQDGEEQDAYILGIDKPLKEFTGVVLAIVHRLNDVEDKWIVVPEGVSFTKEEIIKQVEFQEKYFKIEIKI